MNTHGIKPKKSTFHCLHCGKTWQTNAKGYQYHLRDKHNGGGPITAADRTRALARKLDFKNSTSNDQHTDCGHGQY